LIPSHLSAPAPDRTHRCEQCGCSPAQQLTFRGHRGLIIVMQFLKERGVWCRTCGLAVFRTMTSRTLVQGWWGYGSFLITPFILLYNLLGRLQLNKMAAPVPAADGSSTAPWHPGRPVYARPTIVGLLVPLAFVGSIGYAVISELPKNRIGACVSADAQFVDCAGPHAAVVTRRADERGNCPANSTGYVEESHRDSRGLLVTDVYCLGEG
jgi:hypothetical protein